MKSSPDFNENSTDDSYWESLFEIAEDYEPSYDADAYDYADLCDNAAAARKFYSPEEALKSLFGYDSFRPGQKGVIDSILGGRDTFAVMPTGAGKSVCYQIPAVLLDGVTLVISPLISLMQDQVKAMNVAGIPAAFINSSLSESAFAEVLQKARRGSYRIIYVAPERLLTEGFISLSKSIDISMVTVDEAHCISQWGQDFRPSYMKISEFIASLRHRPVISAFTATATKAVQEDIVCSLGLSDPYVLISGFNRDNLFFDVERPKDKDRYILDYIKEHEGESGIVYCATRKSVDSLHEILIKNGIRAARYHAGMSAPDRKKMQDDFVFDYTGIIVATNAFGMGIDKSNVRFVIHYNMPQSMENYYQEAGRAGRDGLDSRCILLFSPQDIIINRFLLDHKVMPDIDPFDRETIKERDDKRLVCMEKYCYTTDCLRNYILKYFGEHPDHPCENCGNCLREFETVDMTEAAKKIINCVYESGGRFGRNIIIDTVTGSKTARLEETGTVRYKSYGVLSGINKSLLMRLIDQMLLDGYLVTGEYQTVKLGDIRRLKDPDATLLIRITDEDKTVHKVPKGKKKASGAEALTSTGFRLFDELKKLRLTIAREENMPPYIVFNDRTLLDMCAKVPLSKQEMLSVTGVGENKFAKYGARFLAAINEYSEKYPDLIKRSMPAEKEQSDRAERPAAKKSKSGKLEFFLTESEASTFRYSEYMFIIDIRDEMNRICIRDNIKKLPATHLTKFLISENVIREDSANGRFGMAPTKKGAEYGIKEVEMISEKGTPYKLLKYPEKVQRLLVKHYTISQ